MVVARMTVAIFGSVNYFSLKLNLSLSIHKSRNSYQCTGLWLFFDLKKQNNNDYFRQQSTDIERGQYL